MSQNLTLSFYFILYIPLKNIINDVLYTFIYTVLRLVFLVYKFTLRIHIEMNNNLR